ncbi:MAG: response regulator [bacterium]|nr:response regulator [bacterium]
MKNSLLIKTATFIFLTIFLSFLLMGVYSFINDRNDRIANLYDDAHKITNRVSFNLVLPVWNYIYKEMLLREISEKAASDIINYEMANTNVSAIVVYGNFGQLFMGKIRNRKGELFPYEPDRLTLLPEKPFYSTSQPIVSEDVTIGKVVVYMTDRALNRELVKSLFYTLLQLFIVSGITILILFFVLKRIIVDPIISLTACIKEVDEDHWGVTANIRSTDEIGKLAGAFNQMSRQLQKSFEKIKSQVRRIEADSREREDLLEELAEKNETLETENTVRKYVEEELSRSEEKYRSIFENALEGIFRISSSYRLLMVNNAFAKMLGYSSSQEVLENINMVKEFFVDAVQRDSLLDLVVEKKIVEHFEVSVCGKDGKIIPVSINIMSIFDDVGDVRYYEGTLVDITEKRETEELLIAKEAAEAIVRAKGEFLANMSHDIRTPMNAILGFAELLESEACDPIPKKYVSTILSSGKMLLGLINDILDFSKIEAGMIDLQYSAINLRAILKGIEDVFSRKVEEKGLIFVLDIDPSLPQWVVMDEVRLGQILFNLIGNAVKFTAEGQVKLSAHVGSHGASGKTIELVLRIEDTGIGIIADQQEIIFEAFKQQEGQPGVRYGGTGLGLSITRQLVELMEGTISVESEPGKGAVFEIRFGTVVIDSVIQETGQGDEIPGESIQFEPASILIVDDIETNRDLLESYLAGSALTVISAGNGLEAIDLAREHKPDLITMDLRMPGMDGYETIEVLKNDEALKDTPIIIITASVMKKDEYRIISTGAAGFLKKPVNRFSFLRELARFIPYNLSASLKPEPASSRMFPQNGSFNREEVIRSIELLSAEEKDELRKLLGSLESEITEKWDRIRKTFIIGEIEEFAQLVLEKSNGYAAAVLVDWSNKCIIEAMHFDVENLTRTVNEFPGLLKSIKKGL